MVQWYVAIDQVEHGPLDDATLYVWIKQGRVKPDDDVRQHNRDNWVAARTVFPPWFDLASPTTSESPGPLTPPFRAASHSFGILGFVLVPCVILIISFFGFAWIWNHNPPFGDARLLMLIGGCLVLAILGLYLSHRALAMGWKEVRDIRSGNRSQDARGRSIIGCILGVLGMVINGCFSAAFLFLLWVDFTNSVTNR